MARVVRGLRFRAADRRALAGLQPGRNLADSGYAAADALVALIILTMAIVGSLSAVAQGRRLVQASLEARQARAEIGHLLAVTPVSTTPGTMTGRSEVFAWTLAIDDPIRAYGAAALCSRHLRLQAVASGRVFSASTVEICPNDRFEES